MRGTTAKSVFVDGTAGRIQAILETPSEAYSDAVAVVCHPHPRYHGTMNNKVVHTVSRTANRMHRRSIRFNFRGVGSSEGEYAEGIGETEDAISVVRWTRDRWPAAEIWLAGFSFGAFVALKAAVRVRPAVLITVAPPIRRFPVADQPRPNCPWIVIQGEDDELVESAEVSAWARRLRPPPQLEIMGDTDHFFHGRLRLLAEAVSSFLRSRAPACEDA